MSAGTCTAAPTGLREYPGKPLNPQPCMAFACVALGSAVRGAACHCEVRLTILLGPDSVSVSAWQSNGRCQRVQYRQHVRAQQRNWWPDRLHVQSRSQGLRRPALRAPRDGHYPELGGAPVDARGHTDSEEGEATKSRVAVRVGCQRGGRRDSKLTSADAETAAPHSSLWWVLIGKWAKGPLRGLVTGLPAHTGGGARREHSGVNVFGLRPKPFSLFAHRCV